MRSGAHDDLTDVPGMRVGHRTRLEPGWRTGCTVILPDQPAVAGVSVRGGGPGTRETDLLDPRNLVTHVDAVVLSGGSAFGLRTADGVVDWLYAAGRGWPTGPAAHERVPIVPAAIIFDLGRGTDSQAADPSTSTRAEAWRHHPTAEDGWAACAAASAGQIEQGPVGAGTGARMARLVDGVGRPGGIGSASLVLDDGTTVAALVVCNAIGSPVGVASEELVPMATTDAETSAMTGGLRPGTATTVGVVATDATLTKSECAKLADVAHDGLARAIEPVHTAYDGDTFFALATGERLASPDPLATLAIQRAAAECVRRALVKIASG